MTKKKKKLPVLPVALGICAVLAVLTVTSLFGGNTKKNTMQAEIDKGLAYLQSLEEKDPAEVQQVRKAIRQRELEAQLDELLEQLNNGQIDPFSLYQDYVVMGDSRAVGFWYRKYLDKGRVLADGGHTIRNIPDQIDTLVTLNPSTIYLCYGLNDCSIGYWDSAESYAAEYVQVVKAIREKLPDATIVVSSILPARDPAFQKSAKWRNIPEWSAVLEKACKDNGILFANCDKLAEDYPNLWDPDGIHFRKEFYPYWASKLVVTALMEGVG